MSPIDNIVELNLTAKSHLPKWNLILMHFFHFTYHKNWFENLHKSDDGHIVLCDNFVCTIVGVGDVTFDTSFVYTLKKVRYIFAMSRNIISVGRFEKAYLIGKIGHEI